MKSSNAPHANKGFTLVELSIVMIIIGLLIGGIFGGRKLIDNSRIQNTVQQLKQIQSATLTFKDVYRGLPGDLRNASTRLPNCTTAPCSTTNADNGNKILDSTLAYSADIDTSTERFVFWHHLKASDLVSGLNMTGENTMTFGQGQPKIYWGGGFKMTHWSSSTLYSVATNIGPTLMISGRPDAYWSGPTPQVVPCPSLIAIEAKMDDGLPLNGRIRTPNWTNCIDPASLPASGASTYISNPSGTYPFAHVFFFM